MWWMQGKEGVDSTYWTGPLQAAGIDVTTLYNNDGGIIPQNAMLRGNRNDTWYV